MSQEQNVKAVQDLYAAFGRGDIASIVGMLTDDVSWVSHIDPIVPWAGDFSGKARVPKFFEAMMQSVEVDAFEPQEFFTKDDTVVSTGIFGCRANKTGKHAKVKWVFFWKFRGGKISSYEQFEEAKIADAFR